MDNPQIEQALEDLETRMERLRALYEQYFMGLEKLEPTVLRKEVDRKFWVLRREQIRNTGLRFKFQMLVQRFNTYQQYWGRIVREIESGTYRRDILKVAQRFGEKDAMTILGRKRAEQYKRLAANQLERRDRRRGELGAEHDAGAKDRPSMPDITVEEEDAPVSLSVNDLEVIDDDEPVTPPRGLPPVRMYGEPDMESLLLAATVGVTTWRESAPEPTHAPAHAPERTTPATVITPAASPPETSAVAAPVVLPEAKPAPADAKPGARAAVPAGGTAVKPAPAKPVAAPAVSGKSRVAELAAQMRAKKQDASRAMNAELELDRLFEPAEPKPAATVPFTPKRAPVPEPPAASKSVAVPPLPAAPPKRASVPPPPAAAPAPPVASKPVVVPVAPAAPKPVQQPVQQAQRPAPPAASPAAGASRADLSEQKMREIYAKYVGAKRAANESTAGLTFDKLAASLRAQTDKLKSSHPTRSIDFEIVTKDGKTALRPVIK